MTPENARRPGTHPAVAQSFADGSQRLDRTARQRQRTRSTGLLDAYASGRESVLGARVSIPLDDPHAAFDALVRALGGRPATRRFLADVALVARLEGTGR